MDIRPHARRLALAWLLTAAACGVSATEASPSNDRGDGPPPARVSVAAVRDGTLADRWTFLGEVQAMSSARLAAGADGEVVLVGPRVGDRVEAGDVLVRLDVSVVKARVAAAKASRTEVLQELAQARRDRDRARSLSRVLPEAEIERDETRAETLDTRTAALEAAEREAKARLGRHRVTAPFAGVIAARHVDPGDWVGPGDPVLELVDDRQVELLVAGSEQLLAHVQIGEVAVVRHGTDRIEAEIRGVVRALDPTTRTGRLRLVPREVPGWMLPGVSVDVEFTVERGGEGLIVPRDALVYGAVGIRLMRIDDDKAGSVDVQVLATANDEALVKAVGLAAGDQVVIRGNERLRPGQMVSVEATDAQQAALAVGAPDETAGDGDGADE
jgi:RND family efflux transporter MFP subunit